MITSLVNPIQYIVSRFAKSFKQQFKIIDSPLPSNFVPSKKDWSITDTQVKEAKLRFGNLYYSSAIGALFYVSCCTRPDITFAVNKLAKYSNIPGVIYNRAFLLHLIGYIKGASHKCLKFYSDKKESPSMYANIQLKISWHTQILWR